MKEIELSSFYDDTDSKFTYLYKASANAIMFQYTERRDMLLDILFDVKLENGKNANFLIRLETPPEQIYQFAEILNEALTKPQPHPQFDDMFRIAVLGKDKVYNRWKKL